MIQQFFYHLNLSHTSSRNHYQFSQSIQIIMVHSIIKSLCITDLHQAQSVTVLNLSLQILIKIGSSNPMLGNIVNRDGMFYVALFQQMNNTEGKETRIARVVELDGIGDVLLPFEDDVLLKVEAFV
jgi:hypothetical protein